MIDAFSTNFSNPVTDYLKRKQTQIGSSVGQATPPSMLAAPDSSDDATQRAIAASKGQAASAAASAAGTAGQQQQSTQAGAMAAASTAAARPASAPVQPTPPPTDGTFHSTSGDNVKAYLDQKSATLGQDPGAISEAGKLYADRVTNGLKTPDASSVNAQNTQDTAASRRAYLARAQSEEAIGQSGFAPGTAQADRIRMNSQAGVDEANQAGQNSVNAYVRQRTEDNMNRAQGLETQQYNRNRDNLGDAQGQDLQEYGRSEKATDRGLQAAATAYAHGRDTVADSHWDTTNTQQQAQQGVDNAHWSTMNQEQQTQQAVENAQVLKGADETAKRTLLAGLPEGPAKNKVMAGLQNGSLTLQNALDSVFGADGAVKPEYRGQTPGQLGLDAEKEYAQQTVDLQDPNLKTSNPQEYLKKVNAEILAKRNATNAPVDAAKNEADKSNIVSKLNSGASLTPDEEAQAIKTGAIPTVSPANVPTGDGIANYTAQNPSGKFAIGGTVYTISDHGTERTGWDVDWAGHKSPRHTDYTVATDSKGNQKYFYDGAIHDAKPDSSGESFGQW